ncbi:WxcM-like domain-containing protein [Cupriavidus sp. SK-4]|uniref:WxcM-like domain-containing protein n=1 Tax=Cupriavidus sp. SK-4 TaxID=574750 RepID=UPI00055B4292|nr:WxcM-like domain-containing protein [Cupriavidus sp. SK-4]
MPSNFTVHGSADVQSNDIGAGTTIWQSVTVLPRARIGSDVNINAQCFVENDVVIGDRVTIKCGVYVWDGIRLGNDVFVGPNVTFSNDKFPRSKAYPEAFLQTVVEDGASIGAAAVLLPGIVIGQGAMIGAGAVVTRSVPPYAIVTGNPARIVGYVENAASPGGAVKSTSVRAPEQLLDARAHVGVSGVTLHRLKRVHDMRGDLSVGEFPRDIPFDPKRYFLVFNVPSEETRGEHAHHKCHQFLICVRGKCSVVVDDGKVRCEIALESPETGLYLPPLTWGIQYKYSSDAMLLVFASDEYDADDYIRNYAEFVEITKQKNGL